MDEGTITEEDLPYIANLALESSSLRLASDDQLKNALCNYKVDLINGFGTNKRLVVCPSDSECVRYNYLDEATQLTLKSLEKKPGFLVGSAITLGKFLFGDTGTDTIEVKMGLFDIEDTGVCIVKEDKLVKKLSGESPFSFLKDVWNVDDENQAIFYTLGVVFGFFMLISLMDSLGRGGKR